MDYSCISDIGLIREKNQDSYLTLENKYGDFLALVADGIGGGKAGEVASSELIGYFNRVFKESGPFDSIENAIDFINYHLDKANYYIYSLAVSNKDYAGMGTTLTGVLITSMGVLTINCGDSRVYGIEKDELIQLTEDHTLVNQMLHKGQITYSESLNHPKRHYLVKAVGIFESIKFDVNIIKDMKYFLICSDGLHGYVDNDEMLSIILNENISIEERTITLKDIALKKGGYDNITVVLIRR